MKNILYISAIYTLLFLLFLLFNFYLYAKNQISLKVPFGNQNIINNYDSSAILKLYTSITNNQNNSTNCNNNLVLLNYNNILFLVKSKFTKIENNVFLYTDTLNKYDTYLNSYNIDTLDNIFEWIIKLKYFDIVESDRDTKIFLNSVSDYWLNNISNKVSILYNINSNVIYNDKFNFLTYKLKINQYNPSIKLTNFDKIIYNIRTSHYSHLFQSIYNQTTILIKSIISIILFIILYSFYLNIKILIKSK